VAAVDSIRAVSSILLITPSMDSVFCVASAVVEKAGTSISGLSPLIAGLHLVMAFKPKRNNRPGVQRICDVIPMVGQDRTSRNLTHFADESSVVLCVPRCLTCAMLINANLFVANQAISLSSINVVAQQVRKIGLRRSIRASSFHHHAVLTLCRPISGWCPRYCVFTCLAPWTRCGTSFSGDPFPSLRLYACL
jgi:hypothetical protein